MKKLILSLIFFILTLTGAYAQEDEIPLISFPADTEVIGTWACFTDGAFGAGIAGTIVRFRHEILEPLRIDLDLVMERELNQDEATNAGLGLSIGTLEPVGKFLGLAVSVLPNIGLTYIIDYRNLDMKSFDDGAIKLYGTLLKAEWF